MICQGDRSSRELAGRGSDALDFEPYSLHAMRWVFWPWAIWFSPRTSGLENVPPRGPMLFVGNHTLHGALDGAGSFGRVIWSEHFTIDAEGSEGAATCEDGEFLPFIVTTAATLAATVQAFLLSGGKRRVGWTIHPGGTIRT